MYIQEILKQKWVIPVAAGAASAVVGFGTGFLIGRRTGRNEVFDVIRESTDDLTEDAGPPVTASEIQEYLKAKMAADFEKATDGSDVELIGGLSTTLEHLVDEELFEIAADDDVAEEKLTQQSDDLSDIVYERVNVFTDPESGAEWDEEAEAATRIDGEPYVICVEEFIENDNEWAQETVTWYEGDDILADSLEVPMYNPAELLGELKFGHGSGDKNVVYIRSVKQHKEYEVLRHAGRYELEVAGHTIEQEFEDRDLKHSNDRKFRSD